MVTVHYIVALQQGGIQTQQSTGDADSDIVAVAMQLASSGHTVTVYCDDTDFLNLLLFHRSQHMCDVFFWFEGNTRSRGKSISIRHLQTKLGYDVCQQLLVLHAVGGCDTTSSIFGVGKGTILTKLGSNTCMRSNIDVMQDYTNKFARLVYSC